MQLCDREFIGAHEGGYIFGVRGLHTRQYPAYNKLWGGDVHVSRARMEPPVSVRTKMGNSADDRGPCAHDDNRTLLGMGGTIMCGDDYRRVYYMALRIKKQKNTANTGRVDLKTDL